MGAVRQVAHIIELEDGRELAFAELGDSDGTPVLGFHGTPGSRSQMALLDEPAREAGIRLIAPDRPGYGASGLRNFQAADGLTNVMPIRSDSGVRGPAIDLQTRLPGQLHDRLLVLERDAPKQGQVGDGSIHRPGIQIGNLQPGSDFASCR